MKITDDWKHKDIAIPTCEINTTSRQMYWIRTDLDLPCLVAYGQAGLPINMELFFSRQIGGFFAIFWRFLRVIAALKPPDFL